MEAPPQQERILLGTIGGTAVYLRHAGDDWAGNFDAFTIPLGPGNAFGGFAKDYLKSLPASARSQLKKNISQYAEVSPDNPAMIEVSQQDKEHPRFAFLATAAKSTKFDPETAGEAALAIAQSAIKMGVSRIAIPTLGGGEGGLNPQECAKAMVEALFSKLPYRIHSLMEVTITSTKPFDWESLQQTDLWTMLLPSFESMESELIGASGIIQLGSERANWATALALQVLRKSAYQSRSQRNLYLRVESNLTTDAKSLLDSAIDRWVGGDDASTRFAKEPYFLVVDDALDVPPERVQEMQKDLEGLHPDLQTQRIIHVIPNRNEAAPIVKFVLPNDQELIEVLERSGLSGAPTHFTDLLERTHYDLFAIESVRRELIKHHEGSIDQLMQLDNSVFEPGAPRSTRITRVAFDADDPSGTDFLDVTKDARAFARLIASKEIQTPLSIGLFGNWGSGKTFFMRLVKREVKRLTDLSQEDSREQKELAYYRHIAQIEFNAWHYSEGELWASLVEHIFSSLIPKKKGDPVEEKRQKLLEEMELEQTAFAEAQDRVDGWQEQLESAEKALAISNTELNRAAGELAELSITDVLAALELDDTEKKKINYALDKGGMRAAGQSAKSLALELKVADASLRRGGRVLSSLLRAPDRNRRMVLLCLALLTGPMVSLITELLQSGAVVSATGGIATALGSASVWVKSQAEWFTSALDGIETEIAKMNDRRLAKQAEIELKVQKKSIEVDRLQSKVNSAQQHRDKLKIRVEALQQELARTTAPQFLAEFIQSRVKSEDYRKHLGLVALIRRDFEQLSENIDKANREILKGDEGAADFHLNRIVLYIDDLDRCPPEKVAEVLQAVHLFLAFPLFVVVVGVDSRWVSRSLEHEYKQLFGPSTHFDEEQRVQAPYARPHDYLEKIFQIPFWLQPIEEDGIKNMIRGLVGTALADQETAADAQQGNGDGDNRVKYFGGTNFLARAENLDPEALQIRQEELEFMESLSPLLDRSPRSLKRFINLYRLVLAGLSETEASSFCESKGVLADFEAVQIILTILSGPPDLAGRFRHALKEQNDLLSLISNSVDDPLPKDLASRKYTANDLERFQGWAHRVARFAF